MLRQQRAMEPGRECSYSESVRCAFFLFGLLSVPPALAHAAARPLSVQTDHVAEVTPRPPAGSLEAGLFAAASPIFPRYTAAIAAIRADRHTDALPLLREARALAFRELQAGPAPRPLSYRNFVRLLYTEEQQMELVDIERLISRQSEALLTEDKMSLLHEHALLLHNQFLAVRTFTGETDTRLLLHALSAYEDVLGRPSPLKNTVQIGYAALLAEKGDRRGAQAALSQVPEQERSGERLDLSMAYFHLALGERRRALSRLLEAAHRDSWDHPGAQDGRSVRALAYRMNDFDRLRDDPLFIELVVTPEESAR